MIALALLLQAGTLPQIPLSEAAIADRHVEFAADQAKLAKSRPSLETETASTTTVAVGDVKAICRRRPVTGSLVRTTKECHTKGEWARLDNDVRKEAGEYVDHGRGGTNGQ